jgi:phosphoribosylformylglycinamidine synthase
VVFLACEKDELALPDFAKLKMQLIAIHKAIAQGRILAAATIKEGGIAATLTQMCLGNGLGFCFKRRIAAVDSLFILQPGAFLLEMADGADIEELFAELDWLVLGETAAEPVIALNGQTIGLDEARRSWDNPLRQIFPTERQIEQPPPPPYLYQNAARPRAMFRLAQPRVFIPVFPGTNCEYDTARAFSAAGAQPEIFVVRNRSGADILNAVRLMTAAIGRAQIIALAGGFSAADEPDGSGKFIAAMFRNPYLQEAINEFLNNRDGLMLGICNGFQALIKLGLLPYGRISELDADAPTLTFNAIGRHVSTICRTKTVSRLSPWLALEDLGGVRHIALSSGEGRFYANDAHLKRLLAAGQIATQYVDERGQVARRAPDNPNGSALAVEGLTSPDGRIFGRMGHAERWLPGLLQNIPGNKEQKIFQAGVNYFA